MDSLTRFLRSSKTTTFLIVVTIALFLGVIYSGYVLQQKSTSDNTYTQDQATFNRNNPITDFIPYTTPFYSISYDKTNDNSITIKVYMSSPYYRSQALQYMMRYDQEVTLKYKINFIDYVSPLEKGSSNE